MADIKRRPGSAFLDQTKRVIELEAELVRWRRDHGAAIEVVGRAQAARDAARAEVERLQEALDGERDEVVLRDLSIRRLREALVRIADVAEFGDHDGALMRNVARRALGDSMPEDEDAAAERQD